MKLLALLALGLAVCTGSRESSEERIVADHIASPEWLLERAEVEQRSIQVPEFKAGHEYKFVYEGQLALGIPASSQEHSATRLQAVCSVIFESDNKCILRVHHARWGQLNERLPTPRRIVPIEAFEHVPVDEQVKTDIKLPVMFKYENGLITEVTFDGSERPWSANIKRAVLNMLQVNLHKVRRVDRSQEEFSQELHKHNNEFFTVIEPTLEGECETSYTVNSKPSRFTSGKHALNVTKSINFEKCTKRPEYKYNYRFQDMCPTCEPRYSSEEKLLKSSTVLHYKMLCNEGKRRCLIDECRVESQYNMVPFGEEGNVITTYVNQLLKLVKAAPIWSEVRKPQSPIPSDSDMLFTMDWEIEREKFAMFGHEAQGEFKHLRNYDITKKMALLKRTLTKLAHYTREAVEEQAPRQFARVVKTLRFMTPEEIKQCHNKFYQGTPEDFTPEDHKVIKSLLPDAMALCGTRPCVKHVTKLIKEGKITGIRANSLIRKMMNIKTVSPEIIEEIWSVKSHSISENKHALKESVMLTVGSLLNALCMPSEDKLAMESKVDGSSFCPTSFKQQWTQKLITKFHEAESTYEKVLCLKSLANAGLDRSIVELEKIIRNVDKRRPSILRTEAILALRQLREVMPHKIIRVLLPLVLNKKESTPVRITAFYQLMQCNPEKPVLDQLTSLLNKEHNKQVASFMYTTMQTMANSTLPCEKRLAKDLQLSLRLAKYIPVRSWISYSKFMRAQWYDEPTNKGTTFDFTAMNSKESMLPKAAGISVHNLLFGQWKKYLMTLGFRQTGLDQHLRSYMRSYGHELPSSLSDILSGNMQKPKSSYRGELKSIFEQLSLQQRESSLESVEPFSYMYLRYMDQDFMMLPLPFGESVPESMRNIVPEELKRAIREGSIDSLSKLVKQAEKYLSDITLPINVQTATIFSQSSRQIPTSMGIPLRMSIKTPAVFKAIGLLKVDFDQSKPMSKVKVELKNFKPSMVLSSVMKLQTWSPVIISGIKVKSHARIYAPFSGRLSIDTLKPQPEISFVWEPQSTIRGPVDIVRVSTRPVLSSILWNELRKNHVESREVTIHGDNWDRVNTFHKTTGSHWAGVRFSARGQWHRTPENAVTGTPACPLSGPNRLIVTMEPGYEMPKEIRVTLQGKMFEPVEQFELRPTSFKNFYKSSEENSREQFLRESSEEHVDISEEYINKFESGTPVRHQVQLTLDTKGSPVKRQAKLSADCHCGEQMRMCKCALRAERTPVPTVEQQVHKFECEVETLYPKVPYSVEQLSAMTGERFHCNVNAKWGPISSMNHFCNIKIVGDRSQMQMTRLERSPYRRLSVSPQREQYRSLFSPVAQYPSLVKYAGLDEYKVAVHYEMSPFLRNVTNKVYRMIKNKYYPDTSVNQINVNNPDKSLKIKLNIDPINWRYVNVTIKSPEETCKMTDIALPSKFPILNMRRRSSPSQSLSELWNNMVYSPSRAMCQIRSDRIKTFNSVEYNAPITTCYSVVAKDCSSESNSQFAVLIKKQTPSSEQKTLKVITPSIKLIVRAVSEDRLECELNGETKLCSEIEHVRAHGHTVLKVRKTGPYVQCELPESGIKVYFDGFAANIKVSPLYRNVLCGLCNDLSSEYEPSELEGLEESEEIIERRLQFTSPERVRDYFRSFLMRNDEEECDIENEVVDSIRSYERRPLSYLRPIESTYSESIPMERLIVDESQPCERYESCPRMPLFWDENEREICDGDEPLCDRELQDISIDLPTRPTKLRHTIRPVMRTRVLEPGHALCFSKTPVPRCPLGTMPKEYQPERVKIAYACIPRTDLMAELYQREAAQGDKIVPEVEGLPSTYAEDEIVPKTCRYV